MVEIYMYSTLSLERQEQVRREFHELIDEAARSSGLDQSRWSRQDAGDVQFILIPDDELLQTILDGFTGEIAALLSRGNIAVPAERQMRLSLGMDHGLASYTTNGVVGLPLVTAGRLVGVPAARQALQAVPNSDIVLIISKRVHDNLVLPGHGNLNSSLFREIQVSVKEFHEPAFLFLPGSDVHAVNFESSESAAKELRVEQTQFNEALDAQATPAANTEDVLPSSYQAFDETARTLLRRASLLRIGEGLSEEVAQLLLPTSAPSEVVMAFDRLASSQWMITDLLRGGLTFSGPERRLYACGRLAAEDNNKTLDELNSRLREHRLTYRGIEPNPQLVRDYWTTDDQLGYRPYAQAVASFIGHRDSKPPLTIGIKGPWGAGKTSVMRMIRAELDPPIKGRPQSIDLNPQSRQRLGRQLRLLPTRTRPTTRVTNGELIDFVKVSGVDDGDESRAPIVDRPGETWRATVWFNPWMYQSGEQIWAGLADAIIGQVTERLKVGDRERFWLQLNLRRVDRLAVRRRAYRLILERLLPFLVAFCAIVLTALVASATGFSWQMIRPTLALSSTVLGVGGFVRYLHYRMQDAAIHFGGLFHTPASGVPPPVGAASFFDSLPPDPGYALKAGSLHLVQADIARVLDLVATDTKPLVIFVDDLDRCSPGVVAQVIEAISLFLAGQFENCVFVIAMEPNVVAAHIEVAYTALMEKLGNEGGDLGWRFLEKIVQLPLSLPNVRRQEDLSTYVRAMFGISLHPAPELESTSEDANAPDRGSRAYLPPLGLNYIAGPTGGSYLPSADLKDRIIGILRSHHPSLQSLAEITQKVKSNLAYILAPTVLISPAAEWDTLVELAADRVFADLYRDEAAIDAIETALPILKSSNPREIKRYVNLFRFYAFIVSIVN